MYRRDGAVAGNCLVPVSLNKKEMSEEVYLSSYQTDCLELITKSRA
jgi:hypothetical protein